ncbi:MAG: hypothetical protein ACE5RC_09220 [Nitrosopumilus sp.]
MNFQLEQIDQPKVDTKSKRYTYSIDFDEEIWNAIGDLSEEYGGITFYKNGDKIYFYFFSDVDWQFESGKEFLNFVFQKFISTLEKEIYGLASHKNNLEFILYKKVNIWE